MGNLNTIQNGKGSKPRPIRDLDQFNENWDEIFSKKKLEKSEEKLDTTKSYEQQSTNSSRTEKEGMESPGRTSS
jgi:hypothetical protein